MKNSHQPSRAPRSHRAPTERGGARPRRWLHAALALSTVTALAWAWSALPATLTRGPYLQSASSTGMTVVFRTSPAGTSTLRYGTREGPPWDFEVTGPSATEHVLRLANLRPGTRYYYEVSSGGSVLASGEDVYFQTSPPENSRAPLRFLAFGDSGTGSSEQLAVAARMEEVVPQPHFALGLGDLVYEDGAAEDYDPHLFRPYEDLFPRTTFWPTIGNHDAHTNNAQPYIDAFYLPTTSGGPGRPSNTERYYSFDHGMAHFVCLDSETSSSSPGSAMYQWASADLDSARARGKRWLFVFMHHPPYSKGTHDSDDEGDLVDIRQNLVPLFESKGVDMVMVGHSHNYERSFLARNDTVLQNNPGDYSKINTPNGTIYLVSGCGGKTGDGSLDHPLMSVSKGDVAGFNVIDVTHEELRGSFIERDGRTTDLFTIHKAADALAPRIAHAEVTSPTKIEVVFDEPVRTGSSGAGAANLANYLTSRGAITGATLGSDQRTVSLTTTSLPANHVLNLFVRGVADATGNVATGPAQVLPLVLSSGSSGGSGGTPVVPRGATWRYAKGLSHPGATWNTAAFNDSGWLQGQAGFGFEDGDDATELLDMEDGYMSVYLRTRFNVVNPAAVTGMTLNVNYDDGFVAYLNGVEVARVNVPSGQTNSTPASVSHEAGTFEAFDLNAFRSALLPGSNLLAVQAHNLSLTNSDFTIHPELVLRLPAGGGGSGRPPVAVMGCDVQEANAPSRVAFSARGSTDPDGGNLSYAWAFGDGSFGFGPWVEHTYNQVGTYTVTLLVRDGEGLDAVEQHTVRVHTLGNAPLARVSASSTQITAGGRVDFNSGGSLDPDGGAVHLQWDFGEPSLGPGNTSTQANPSHVFARRGKYAVTLSVTDDEGSTTTQTVLVRVN